MSTTGRTDAWVCAGKADRPPRARIVALGGDGVGPEVVRAAVACLRALGLPLDISEPEHGATSLATKGTAFPDELRDVLRSADGILFGAIDSTVGHCLPILRFLRFGLDTYANVRPATSLGAWGVPSALDRGPVDMVIVRELTEGMYPGREGDLAELTAKWPELTDALKRPLPKRGLFAVQVVTEEATRRVAAYAAELAKHRQRLGVGRGHVTIVAKDNVLRQSDGMFREICARTITEAGGLTQDHLYVDDAARRIVAAPGAFDVVVTTNLYGDILSDIAGELMGGIAMAPSAAIGDRSAYFEACHGSAPDIAGRDVANPSATILSAAMMLVHLGFAEAAERLRTAVLSTIRAGCRTADLGGDAKTSAFTDAVCRTLQT